jgi:hypothetical protein
MAFWKKKEQSPRELISKKPKPVLPKVILEGAHYGSWSELRYTEYSLDVPENISAIHDEDNTYAFYGQTEDFQNICKEEQNSSVLEIADSINFRIFHGTCRAIYVKDGRIFINQDILDNKDYMSNIESLVMGFKEILEGKLN